MLVDATASSGLHYFRGAAELIDALRCCNIHPAVNRGKRRGMRRAQTSKGSQAMRTWITPPIVIPAGLILLAAYAAVPAFT